MAVYACSIAMSIWLLAHFHARAWYLHVLSVAAALALGFARFPSEWNGPALDLALGFFFTFLLVWGIAAPFFRGPRPHSHA